MHTTMIVLLATLLPSATAFVCTGNFVRDTHARAWLCGASPIGEDTRLSLTAITGDLSLLGDEMLTQAEFPALTTVGNISIQGNAALKLFSMPNLKDATSLTVVGNTALGSFNAAAITKLSLANISSNPAIVSFDFGQELIGLAALEVRGNTNLGYIRMDSLAHLTRLVVTDNGLLNAVNMTALSSASTIDVANNGVLVQCQFPALVKAGSLLIGDNANLNLINLGWLQSVEGSLAVKRCESLSISPSLTSLASVGALLITENSALVALTLPALLTVGGAVNLSANAALKTVSFASLASAGALHVIGNAALSAVTLNSIDSLVGPTVDCAAAGKPTLLCMHSLRALAQVNLPALDLAEAMFTDTCTHFKGGADAGCGTNASSPRLPRIASTAARTRLLDAIACEGDLTLEGWQTPGDSKGNWTCAGAPVSDPSVYTATAGALVIRSTTLVSDVTLPFLAKVGTSVLIGSNGGLRKVTLSGLLEVGADVVVQSNAPLRSFNFSALAKIGGSLMCQSNPSLNSFYAERLETIGATLTVASNPVLNSVELASLTNIHAVAVRTCSALNKVVLPSVTELDSLVVESLSSMNRFDLPALKAVGALIVRASPLNEFDLSGLATAGDVTIKALAVMLDLRLPSLRSARSFDLLFNSQLNSCGTLPSLTSLSATLSVVGNGNMRNGCDFPALETVGGGVEFSGNPQISRLTMAKLTHVAGSVSLVANTALVTAQFDALSAVDGDVVLAGSAPIDPKTFRLYAKLPALKIVSGAIRVEDCPGIAELNVPSLTTVGKSLRYAYNGVDGQSARIEFTSLMALKGVEECADGKAHNLCVDHNQAPICAFSKLEVTGDTYYTDMCCQFSNAESDKCKRSMFV